MKHKAADFGILIAFFLTALLALVYCCWIPGKEALFPAIAAMGMMCSSGGLLIHTAKDRRKKTDFSDTDMKKAATAVLALILYTLSLKITGYFIPTVLLGSFTVWFLKSETKCRPLVTGFLVTAAVFGVFGVCLGVPLPLPFFME